MEQRELKMLALKTGVMQPQAKEYWKPTDTGGRNKCFCGASGGSSACSYLNVSPVTLALDYLPPEL